MGIRVLLGSELYPGQHEEAAARRERQDRLEYQLRGHIADVMIELSSAVAHPSCSRLSMERAFSATTKALAVATSLDPEDE